MKAAMLAAMMATVVLAACDSSDDDGGGPPTLDDLRDRSDANLALIDRLDDLDPASDLPDTGSVVYEGYAGILLDTPGTQSGLIGDAEFTADFADEDLSGRIDNFAGRIQGGGAREFDGALTVDEGDIGIVTGGDFGANVGGVLTGGGDVIGVDGSIFGSFVADGDGDVAGLTGVTSGTTDFTLNGDRVDGDMSVAAEAR